MMGRQVVLCVDSESLRNPQLIGLEGENLETQEWLRVFCSAVEARNYLQTNSLPREVWVASSDEVDSINLAAALKKDSVARKIHLLAFQDSGSLKSRAHSAGLDESFSQEAFMRRYSNAKQYYQGLLRQQNFTTPKTESEGCQNALFEQTKTTSPFGIYHSTSNTKERERKAAHVISVLSASGGSGKSTISALMALFSQGLGYQTLLLDADLQFGDLHYMLGAENPLTVSALMEDVHRLSKLQPNGLEPALLAAPCQVEQSEKASQQLPSLLEHLKASFDVIIINTGAFWTEQHIALLEQSSTALFLLDQRASSLQACKHALQLCSRCGLAAHPFVFVLNRCARNAPFSSIDVSCSLQGAHVLELQEGGREVGEFLGAGIPFELIKTRNNLCLSIESLLLDILPQRENASFPKENLGKVKRFRSNRRRRKAACL